MTETLDELALRIAEETSINFDGDASSNEWITAYARRLLSAHAARAEPQLDALDLAIAFHHTYERLAPNMGYDTRKETRIFDPESANGKLMIAVCAELLPKLYAAPQTQEGMVMTAKELDSRRLDWLDQHCAFVADPEYKIGPFQVGELRQLADAGLAADWVTKWVSAPTQEAPAAQRKSQPHQWTSAMAHAGYMVYQHPDIQCAECGAIYAAMEVERVK